MTALRKSLLAAVQAGRFGADPEPDLVEAISEGGGELKLEDLGFDSLGWMEFCISIELDTGQELTPADIETMTRFSEIEDWLSERAARS